MAFSQNLLLSEPPAGDPAQTNNWATMVNTNMSLLDTAVAGLLPLAVTGGNLVLTSNQGAPDQSRNAHFAFTGVLASNELVLMPAGLSRMFSVSNACTGAFTLTVGVNDGSGSAAAGTTVTVPQGVSVLLYSDGTNVKVRQSGPVSTRTVLNVGSGTYNTPAGCVQIRVRLWAAGGGGGGGGSTGAGGTNGSGAGNSSFNGIIAAGGSGGLGATGPAASNGGNGGSGGSGSASVRFGGQAGSPGTGAPNPTIGSANGGTGGGQGGGNNSSAGTAPGAGGGGGGVSGSGTGGSGGGGGQGEYLELIINNPVVNYAYAVGGGGGGGSGGTGGTAGGNGADGICIVDEFYS